MSTMPAPAEQQADLLPAAIALLDANTEHGEKDGRTYRFSVPSRHSYPFQWLWDSCFHAIVYAAADAGRAADELRALLAWQHPEGFVPHVVFWAPEKVSRFNFHHLESAGRIDFFLPWRTPRTSALIQPPLLAQAAEAIVEAGSPPGFLAELLEPIARSYRYLLAVRDHDGDGLVSIVTQFESGLDYSPVYDELSGANPARRLSAGVRPRFVELANKLRGYDARRILRRSRRHAEDVLVNAVLADGLYALARLARRARRDELERWARGRGDRTRDALLERCYTGDGLFFGLAGPEERPLRRVTTVQALLPLVVETLPADVAAAVVERLTDPRRFWAPWPVPSVALDEPTFTERSRIGGIRYIWRGPSALSTNWLLARGLRAHGFDGIADDLAERSRELVRRGGFNEFYEARSGDPCGAADFGWAALAAVM